MSDIQHSSGRGRLGLSPYDFNLTPIERAKRYDAPYKLELVRTKLARVYLIYPRQATAENWAYGGLRALPHHFGLSPIEAEQLQQSQVEPRLYAQLYKQQEQLVIKELLKLATFESGIKHKLIDFVVKQGLIERVRTEVSSDSRSSLIHLDQIDEDFERVFSKRVYGGRGVFVPHDSDSERRINEMVAGKDRENLEALCQPVAQRLNELGGVLKLTPDFGRNAFLADVMSVFTPNVLGVPFYKGGAEGKSDYTATGILQAIKMLEGRRLTTRTPVTILGAHGALGSAILAQLRKTFSDVAVSDISFNSNTIIEGCSIIQADKGRIPDEALRRGGLLITATLRNELEKSNYHVIPKDTIILLAQNHSIEFSESGVKLVQSLNARDITVIPGQLLTLAGALTARMEWAWRSVNGITDVQGEIDEMLYFPKQLAHIFSAQAVKIILEHFVYGDLGQTRSLPYITLRESVGLWPGSKKARPWQ